jgi:succinate dehydrogenase / fumarate reductase flavoprotein subunit
MSATRHLSADVLVIGAGGAGMYAALQAQREGASVLLVDRSLIGRGGSTVMAQMTVAAAMGGACPDHWEHHLADTITAGRGLCEPALARLVCEQGVECIAQLDDWGVGWARSDDRYAQVHAPGHDRARCVYVDFLDTGPAVSRTLRTRLVRTPEIRRIGELAVTDLVLRDGRCCGAIALHLPSGTTVSLQAEAVIVATGGLTRLYRRNSGSANSGGDGYALALRAGAELVDMEFVQFFPIGHLAPRLIGMDPIMWDPFRYKLGGRLLNAQMEEFTERYGTPENGQYRITRDQATYAITKEVAAGRGSPHGGAWLSFQHLDEATLRQAFGPVIDRLASNGIDLTQTPIEVAPIAHYHMGGIAVDEQMRTGVEGLFAAGEAIGGSNGANRLSGNAITEALVFGRLAGTHAARFAREQPAASSTIRWQGDGPERHWLENRQHRPQRNCAALIEDLQSIMAEDVGPFRSASGLARAREQLASITAAVGDLPPGGIEGYDAELLDWLDLRQMLLVATCVTEAAIARTESRGAHQREDHPGLDDSWQEHLAIRMQEGKISLKRQPIGALDRLSA